MAPKRKASAVPDAKKVKSDSPAAPAFGRDVLEWLLAPVSVDDFFSNYWEKKPLIVKRKKPGYYGDVFSRALLDHALRTLSLPYVDAVNLVKYEKGERKDMNGSGRAKADDVWKRFDRQGATLQVRHPQQYCDGLWSLLYAMEKRFECLVGTNVYCTPPGAQGLPPHWDDIEAFVLQIEGEKRWRLYKPHEQLPREYSRDLLQSELGAPTDDVVLEDGDMMYFPRGTIHQAVTSEKLSSIHVTLSTYQKFAWVDFLQVAASTAIENAAKQVAQLRAGLPLNFLSKFGAGGVATAAEKAGWTETAQKLLERALPFVDLGPAADMFAMDFTVNCLPPPPSAIPELSEAKLTLSTGVRWRDPTLVRLVVDGADALLYTILGNEREHHMAQRESPPDAIRLPVAAAAGLARLFALRTDEYVPLREAFPAEREEESVMMAVEVFMTGLLACK